MIDSRLSILIGCFLFVGTHGVAGNNKPTSGITSSPFPSIMPSGYNKGSNPSVSPTSGSHGTSSPHSSSPTASSESTAPTTASPSPQSSLPSSTIPSSSTSPSSSFTAVKPGVVGKLLGEIEKLRKKLGSKVTSPTSSGPTTDGQSTATPVSSSAKSEGTSSPSSGPTTDSKSSASTPTSSSAKSEGTSSPSSGPTPDSKSSSTPTSSSAKSKGTSSPSSGPTTDSKSSSTPTSSSAKSEGTSPPSSGPTTDGQSSATPGSPFERPQSSTPSPIPPSVTSSSTPKAKPGGFGLFGKLKKWAKKVRQRFTKRNYKVKIISQDDFNPQDKVFIKLYGKSGKKTAFKKLEDIYKKFEGKSEADFDIKARNFDTIDRITIKRKSKGPKKDWFIRKIVVTDFKGKMYEFLCKCTLSKDTGLEITQSPSNVVVQARSLEPASRGVLRNTVKIHGYKHHNFIVDDYQNRDKK